MKGQSKSSDSNTDLPYPRLHSRWRDKETDELVHVSNVSPADHLLILRPVGCSDTIFCGIKAFYRHYENAPEQFELPLG